jgi:hypothetical protein
MSKAADVINLLEKAKPSYEFKSANLWYYGTGRDSNGNKTIILSFADEKKFSIQSNQNFPSMHRMDKKDLNVTPTMEKEIVDYISEYGSKLQKSKLKIYGRKG